LQWYSGGPLSIKLGNELAAKGVNLHSVYGATEFGAPVSLFPETVLHRTGEWEYIQFDHARMNPRWIQHASDHYELQFLVWAFLSLFGQFFND
jgi:hypothetical protein